MNTQHNFLLCRHAAFILVVAGALCVGHGTQAVESGAQLPVEKLGASAMA
jgi:hypothetical protein